MRGESTPWRRLCEDSASLRCVDWSLRGIGEVLLQDPGIALPTGAPAARAAQAIPILSPSVTAAEPALTS